MRFAKFCGASELKVGMKQVEKELGTFPGSRARLTHNRNTECFIHHVEEFASISR